MFKKNKVLAFLLLGITFGFSNLTSLVKNTKTSSNIEEKTTFFAKNDFDTHISEGAWGIPTAYHQSTGWKILVSDDSLASCIKTHNNFTITLNYDMWYVMIVPDMHGRRLETLHFDSSRSEEFSKSMLVNNQVEQKAHHGEVTQALGYVTEDFKIFFKLVDNTIYFQLFAYICSGWCLTITQNGVDASLKKGSSITFF